MKYCYKCGKAMQDDAEFCPACGTKQTVTNPEKPVSEKKKSKAGLIIGIAAGGTVLLAAAIAAVVYFAGSGNGSTEETQRIVEISETTAAVQTTEAPAPAPAPEPATAATQAAVAETTAAASEPVTQTEAVAAGDEFLGFWTNFSGKVELNIEKTGDGYAASAYFHSSAWAGTDINMTCRMEGDKMVYKDAVTKLTQYSTAENASYEPAVMIDSYNGIGQFYLVKDKAAADAVTDATVLFGEGNDEAGPFLVWQQEPAQRLSDEYIIWYSDQILITEYDMPYNKDVVRYARNEIYARYGRRFNDPELQSYFDSKSWYFGTTDPDAFDENRLNAVEKENIKSLSEYENSLPTPEYTVYTMNCHPYDGVDGIKSVTVSEDGYYLTIEGVINNVYQTKQFGLWYPFRFISSGGAQPDYDISQEQFLNTLQSLNGLGLTIETDGSDSIFRAALCS